MIRYNKLGFCIESSSVIDLMVAVLVVQITIVFIKVLLFRIVENDLFSICLSSFHLCVQWKCGGVIWKWLHEVIYTHPRFYILIDFYFGFCVWIVCSVEYRLWPSTMHELDVQQKVGVKSTCGIRMMYVLH